MPLRPADERGEPCLEVQRSRGSRASARSTGPASSRPGRPGGSGSWRRAGTARPAGRPATRRGSPAARGTRGPSSSELSVGGSGSRIGSALTHRAPPMSAWPLPSRARYSPRIMKASAPVGSSADSPRRATVPMVPNLPSMRGTSRIRRLPWRAASIAAFWLSPSTARVTDMWGRTTTSSMGRTGSSSDLGVAMFEITFTQARQFPIVARCSGAPDSPARFGQSDAGPIRLRRGLPHHRGADSLSLRRGSRCPTTLRAGRPRR